MKRFFTIAPLILLDLAVFSGFVLYFVLGSESPTTEFIMWTLLSVLVLLFVGDIIATTAARCSDPLIWTIYEVFHILGAVAYFASMNRFGHSHGFWGGFFEAVIWLILMMVMGMIFSRHSEGQFRSMHSPALQSGGNCFLQKNQVS